jgi:hypothetical protein
MMARRRDGIALFVVVLVCAVIATFVAVVTFHGRDSKRKGAESRDRAQALFLGRGAQNHFLLKLKVLPAELYDAVSYSVGKNPYFNFSQEVKPENLDLGGNKFTGEADAAAGPMFFTGEGGTQVSVVSAADPHLRIDRAAEGDGIYSNAAVGFPKAPDNAMVMRGPLDQYLLDIATGYPVFNGNAKGVVVVSAEPHAEAARMGKPFGDAGTDPVASWADPFTGSYRIKSVKILGIGGDKAAGKRFQSDSVLLTAESSVLRVGQVSPASRVNGQLKPILVQREIESGFRTDGSAELVEKLEDQSLYAARTSNTSSGRRTEVTTAVYLVTRKK